MTRRQPHDCDPIEVHATRRYLAEFDDVRASRDVDTSTVRRVLADVESGADMLFDASGL